jgi:D-sedoheptulose 7-phosphate isomerase
VQNAEYIATYLQGMRKITDEISHDAIDTVIEALFEVYQRDGTIWICGNGGSASTATHFACDLTKATIRPGKPRVKAMALADNIPLVSALTNDDGWDAVYLEQLRSFFRPGDAVIGISVHGGSGRDKAGAWSQNLLRALDYARQHDGIAIGLAGFDGGAMRELCHYCIVVPYDTTPHVESYHVALHHLIAFCLAEKIERL